MRLLVKLTFKILSKKITAPLSNSTSDIASLFTAKGANFLVKPEVIAHQLDRLKVIILDWDGVFNGGVKLADQGSPFSEVDSMGLNMLRFAYYLKHGFIPAVIIVTGENNHPALHLSKREHFDGVYIKMKNKLSALHHIEAEFGAKREETGFVFDDILDLDLATEATLRFYITRNANPLLNQYITDNGLAEYYTANSGKDNAVREISELCIGLLGNYTEVLKERVGYSARYQAYLADRNKINTQIFSWEEGQISEYSFG
jgi:3-deoxy-D-manno-octulosonate 8-phosphate phosphatase (KDO 8-P phosphatase)